MALYAPSATHPPGAMGDAAPGRNSKSRAVSCPRYLLLHYGKSRDAHVLYGRVARSLLVWIHRSG